MLKSKNVLYRLRGAEVINVTVPALKNVFGGRQIPVQRNYSSGTLRVEFNPTAPVGAGFFGREAVSRLEK